MSFLGDNFGFEKFQLGDWWNKIKKNPEQLLIGAGDPLSAKMWSKITGKKYEPFVDQMGGPYGGHTISAFSNNDGGVYGRAEASGIDTGAAKNMQDAAHVVAAIYGGSALGSLGGGASSGASAGFPSTAAQEAAHGGGQIMGFGGAGTGGIPANLAGNFAGTTFGGGNAGAFAQAGGIPGGAGIGTATESPGFLGGLKNMTPQQMAQLGQSMPGQQQQQQTRPDERKPYLFKGKIVWM